MGKAEVGCEDMRAMDRDTDAYDSREDESSMA
jgi:hypothetical protein